MEIKRFVTPAAAAYAICIGRIDNRFSNFTQDETPTCSRLINKPCIKTRGGMLAILILCDAGVCKSLRIINEHFPDDKRANATDNLPVIFPKVERPPRRTYPLPFDAL